MIHTLIKYTTFCTVALRPNAGYGVLVLEICTSHTATHHSRCDSSGRVISLSQRPLPDNAQISQQINIHAHGGSWTRNPKKREAADQRLRPHGHRHTHTLHRGLPYKL